MKRKITPNPPSGDLAVEEDALIVKKQERTAQFDASSLLGGESKTLPYPRRKPRGTVYRACDGTERPIATHSLDEDEVNNGPMKHTNLPVGLTRFNFAPLGDGARRVLVLNEDWIGDAVSHPTHMMALDCDPSWDGAGQWWEDERPVLRNRLVPFVKDHMRETKVREVDQYGCLFQDALINQQSGGMTYYTMDASDALIMWGARHPRTAGGRPTLHVRWGDRYPSVDYASQELTIGNLSFLCVDMGFALPLSTHLRTALNEPDTVKRNQCVFAHIALALGRLPLREERKGCLPKKGR